MYFRKTKKKQYLIFNNYYRISSRCYELRIDESFFMHLHVFLLASHTLKKNTQITL